MHIVSQENLYSECSKFSHDILELKKKQQQNIDLIAFLDSLLSSADDLQ